MIILDMHTPTSEQFTIPFNDTILVGDIFPADTKPDVLILHGAGKSNRKRYDYLRTPLAQDNIATCAFDCIGHGETGGEITATCLRDRTEQAARVIEKLSLPQPLGLLGGSMGAYTAIKLTELYPVDRLVLVVPAVYRADVYSVPFGEDFSSRIRKSESWLDTDAWDILSRYQGKLLIAAAEKDEVVKPEIPQRIYEAATQAKEKELYIFKQAGHQIREFLLDPEHEAIFDDYYQKVREILAK